MNFTKAGYSIHSIACLTIIGILCGCNNNTAVPAKPAVPAGTNLPVAARFDTLEQFFQNNNWLLITGNDSNYLYCSRTGKAIFTTTYYKMIKGDSVNIMTTHVQHRNDTFNWQVPPDTIPVQLANQASGKLLWMDKNREHKYVFQKKDSSHILLIYPDGKKSVLVKIPSLSTFLVRSKYDYQHGTRLAFQKDN